MCVLWGAIKDNVQLQQQSFSASDSRSWWEAGGGGWRRLGRGAGDAGRGCHASHFNTLVLNLVFLPTASQNVPFLLPAQPTVTLSEQRASRRSAARLVVASFRLFRENLPLDYRIRRKGWSLPCVGWRYLSTTFTRSFKIIESDVHVFYSSGALLTLV